MTWYNPGSWFNKANPAQEVIYHHEGSMVASDTPATFAQAFEKLETVNRGVNMIVTGCSSMD
jgi:hypothetical protein